MQGRRINPAEMAWLADWMQAHPHGSRKRLARELCQRWQWVDGRGRLNDFAARSLLLKLEGRGLMELPTLRRYNRRTRPPPPTWAGWQEPARWEAELAAIAPVEVKPVMPGTVGLSESVGGIPSSGSICPPTDSEHPRIGTHCFAAASCGQQARAGPTQTL